MICRRKEREGNSTAGQAGEKQASCQVNVIVSVSWCGMWIGLRMILDNVQWLAYLSNKYYMEDRLNLTTEF